MGLWENYQSGKDREREEWIRRLEQRCKNSVEFLKMLEIHLPYQAKAEVRDFIKECPLLSEDRSRGSLEEEDLFS